MLLCVNVSATLGRSLVSWTIIEVNDESYTLDSLFASIRAGRFDSVVVSEELKKAAKLLRSLAGSQRDELMATSNGQLVLDVCREFGKYVRFSVELVDEEPPPPVTATTDAFAVMAAAQKRLQLGNNSLPFPEQVKDSRDRLYNNLIGLMKEMGISWNVPSINGVSFMKKLRDCLWHCCAYYVNSGQCGILIE